MSKFALPCIACGRELRNVMDDAENQPYNGTAFETHGHYGSTIYDPMDGHYLEINVCDACLAAHPERCMEGRDRRPVIVEGVVTNWDDVKWRLVPWDPPVESVSYALDVMRKERGEELAPRRTGRMVHGDAEATVHEDG